MDSHWQRSRHPYPTTGLPAEAEIVIVGAGIVGCSLALALAEAGLRPLLIERDAVASGASGRNGGLLLPGTAELFGPLVERWGVDRARLLWAASTIGAERLVERIDDLEAAGLDCGWRAEGGLHVAMSESEARALESDASQLSDLGFDARWLDRAELARFSDMPLSPEFRGALLVPGGGCFHSGRLVTALAAAACQAGARIVEDCAVTAIARDEPVELKTANGRLRAGQVLLCNNAWIGALMPELASQVTPVRGQVLATAPLPPRRIRGGWSLNHGYEYLQQRPDGRLILGGMRWTAEDRELGQDRAEPEPGIQARLEGWLAAHWPGFAGRERPPESALVDCRWGGIMGWTPDRLPIVGAAPERPGLWLACGFSGHGVPFAQLAAQLLLPAIRGDEPPKDDVGAGFGVEAGRGDATPGTLSRILAPRAFAQDASRY